MIESVEVKNFKCFQGNRRFDLGHVTLLAGVNGVGKSSLIQGLLLARQSHPDWKELRLNGDLLELGQTNDAFCADAEDDELRFALIVQPGKRLAWRYRFTEDRFELIEAPADVGGCALFGSRCHYICADRWGPRRLLPMSRHDIAHGNLGKYGEYTAHYLETFGDRQLPEINPRLPVRNPDEGKDLLHQVQEWLNELSPGTRLEPKVFRELNESTLTFAFRGEFGYSRGYRATNVGFGLSYTLPIIVALLSLPPGGLVILENPEAHLHPRGQTIMGRLIALAAAGVQVIVETHGDHVLNGIRIAVREGLLAPEPGGLSLFHPYRTGCYRDRLAPYRCGRQARQLAGGLLRRRYQESRGPVVAACSGAAEQRGSGVRPQLVFNDLSVRETQSRQTAAQWLSDMVQTIADP